MVQVLCLEVLVLSASEEELEWCNVKWWSASLLCASQCNVLKFKEVLSACGECNVCLCQY